jgi:hypothetical protein
MKWYYVETKKRATSTATLFYLFKWLHRQRVNSFKDTEFIPYSLN